MRLIEKELMIGNLIEYAGVICEVEEIHKKTITTNGVNAPISSFLSIPLTEEWLLKFGFIKDEDLGDMIYYQMPEKKRGYGVCFDHDEIVLYHYNILGITNLIYDSEHFQNVHQLQNIYFALTGEELTINNK